VGSATAAVTVAATALVVPVVATATTAGATTLGCLGNQLASGAPMNGGQCLASSNAGFKLVMQTTGNLELYNERYGNGLWSTGTPGHPGGWAVDDNGNLVVYPGGGGNAVWASNTGTTGATVVLRTTGNLVVTSSGRVLWETKTQASAVPCAGGGVISQGNAIGTGAVIGSGGCLQSGNGKFELQMQATGNLALRSAFAPTDGITWSAGTGGHPGAWAIDQGGNFIVYPAGGGDALWASNTGYSRANGLVQTTGNFVLYSPTGPVLWATDTVYSGNLGCIGTTLTIGQTLQPGQCLSDGASRLTMQTDGNLVSYFDTPSAGPTVVWAAGTSGTGNKLTLPKTLSGVAQIVGPNTNPIKTLGTQVPGNQPDRLTLQSNGNVLVQVQVSGGITGTRWKTTWQSGCRAAPFSALLTATSTMGSPSGDYLLLMQGDGNLVLYIQPSHTAIWSTGTQGNPGAYAVQQTDGNLVVYSADGQTALWQSGTTGTPSSTLAVQDDGNVVVYGTNPSGPYAAWSSGTVGDKGTSLLYGQDLQPGQYLQSATGQYRAAIAPDGLLVLYLNQTTGRTRYACPIWTPGEDGSRSYNGGDPTAGSYLTVGSAGLVTVYPPGTTRKSPRWTALSPSTRNYDAGSTWDTLTLQTTGNLVLYNAPTTVKGRQALWDTATYAYRGQFLCTGSTLTSGQFVTSNAGEIYMDGCNLYFDRPVHSGSTTVKNTSITEVYSTPDTKAALTSNTAKTCHAAMQGTGNLVMYHRSTARTVAVWQSKTTQATTPHFDASALGPYAAIVVHTTTINDPALDVVTSHAKVIGTPYPKTKTGSKILGYILTAIGLVFDIVGGPLGAISTALGTLITYGGIADAALGAGNSFWAAGHTLTGPGGSVREALGPTSTASPSSTAASSSAVSSCGPGSPNQLTAGMTLQPGGCLWAGNGTYRLAMQTDGNLVLYAYRGNQGATPEALWNSGTNQAPTGTYAWVLPTGALAVVAPTGRIQWTSGTTGTDPVLRLKGNGDLVLWNGTPGAPGSVFLWQTATSAGTVTACASGASPSVVLAGETLAAGSCLLSPNGQYELVMQADGNLVEYLLKAAEPLWASGTGGHPTAVASLAPGAELAVSAPTTPTSPYWRSSPGAAYGILSLQNDGNVVVYGNNGKVSVAATPYAVWQTGTGSLRGTQLAAGEQLMPGQYLESKNGQYKLTMGATGTLQLTLTTAVTTPGATPYVCPIWSEPGHTLQVSGSGKSKSYSIARTTFRQSFLTLQPDGNLVVSKPTGTTAPVFDSAKTLNGSATVPYLALGTDGNVVVYPSPDSGTALWTSGTNWRRGTGLCTNEKLRAGQQVTGISPTGSSHSRPLPTGQMGDANYLAMQATCNLVFYSYDQNDRQTVIQWASGATTTTGGCYATVQGTGNFVVYSAGGTALWSSGTKQASSPPQLVKNLGPYDVVVTTANGTNGVWVEVVTDAGKVLWAKPHQFETSAGAGESDIVQALVQVLTYLAPIVLGA